MPDSSSGRKKNDSDYSEHGTGAATNPEEEIEMWKMTNNFFVCKKCKLFLNLL